MLELLQNWRVHPVNNTNAKRINGTDHHDAIHVVLNDDGIDRVVQDDDHVVHAIDDVHARYFFMHRKWNQWYAYQLAWIAISSSTSSIANTTTCALVSLYMVSFIMHQSTDNDFLEDSWKPDALLWLINVAIWIISNTVNLSDLQYLNIIDPVVSAIIKWHAKRGWDCQVDMTLSRRFDYWTTYITKDRHC